MARSKYVMIRATEEEKKTYKQASILRGLRSVTAWFIFLAHKDLKSIEKKEKNND